MTFFESSSVVQIVEHLLYDNFVLTLQHFFFDDITKLHWLSYAAFTPEMLPLSIIFGNTGRQIWPKPWQHRWAALLSTRHKGFQDLQRSSFTTTNQLSTHTHIWSCVSIYLTLLQKLLAFVSVLVALYTSTLVVYIIKKIPQKYTGSHMGRCSQTHAFPTHSFQCVPISPSGCTEMWL